MEKRVLIAMVLSVLVIVFFDFFASKYYKKPAKRMEGTKTERVLPDGETKQAEKEKSSLLDFSGEEILVETDVLRVVFSRRGGWIKKIFLKQYKDNEKQEIDLIEGKGSGGLWFDQRALNLGECKVARTRDGKGGEKISLSCLYPTGLEVKKTFTFIQNEYKFNFFLELINRSDKEIELEPFFLGWGPGIKEEIENQKERLMYSRVNIYQNGKVKKVKESKIKKEIKVKGEIKWLGLNSKYFLVALIPQGKDSEAVVRKSESNGMEMGLAISGQRLSPRGREKYDIDVFAGPKKYTLLQEQGQGLEKNIDFGFFSYFSVALLSVLNWIYGIARNYGLAILILTLVVKIILAPLTKKSVVSMQKMQRLQPEIARLKKKHKNDSKKLQMETMQIYKERKINPLAGCLPMVLQIPIFWALFNTLRLTIELRQAPFFGWISDLSRPDTIFHLPFSLPVIQNNVNLLPIIMILTQVVQQKMVPSTAQSKEQKLMFYAMPVVFGVMFYNFPSGLVLYWTLNNIFTIIQQYFIMKKIN